MPAIFVNGRFLTQPTTGVQRYAREVVGQWDEWLADGRLDSQQWSISVLVPRRGVVHSFRSIPVRSVGWLAGHAWEQLDLPRYVGEGLLFCPCNTAPVRSLFGKTDTVVTVHDVSYRHFPDAYSRAFRAAYSVLTPIILRRADLVLTDAHSERRSIEKNFPDAEAPVRVIHLGGVPRSMRMALEKSANPPSRNPKSPFVLYVGSLCRRKNIEGILQAATYLHQSNPNVDLVVAGGSARAFGRDQTHYIQGKSRIEFIGRVDDGRLVELYHNASCFVFPSFHEGSGLPPIEAMAAGCPVVASAIPVHYEHLGDAAIYCDPHDPADIARKIRTVLEDPALADGLRKRGLRKAAEFSWARCAAETLEAISEVVDGKNKRTAKPGRAAA